MQLFVSASNLALTIREYEARERTEVASGEISISCAS
ncbi:MAG: hypothetical protein QOF93_174 [Verrucomicrobiota bacterium]